MYILRSIAAAVFSVSIFTVSIAHSTARNPLTYLTTVENVRVNTPSNRIHALSSFDLTFELHDGQQTVKLTLAPNHDVLAEGATVSYLAPDGSIRSSAQLNRADYRVFKGETWLQNRYGSEWTNVGWARIMVDKDGDSPIFEGTFRIDGNHHHVQTRTHYMHTKHALDPALQPSNSEYMIVWRDSDIGGGLTEDYDGNLHGELKRGFNGQASCSANKLNFNSRADHPVYMAMAKREEGFFGMMYTRSIFGRQIDSQTGGNSAGVNLTSTIGSTAGCPSARRVALVGVATDCTYTAGFNSTETARANVINVINSASVQYENSFNITLGLQNLTISDAACPATAAASAPWNVDCDSSLQITDRLNLFSAWRGQSQDSNAYWSLFSTCGTDSAVGLSWLGQACVATAQVASSSTGNETVSGTNVVVRTSTEWEVFAHETGHTFGAVHDCDSTTCSDGTTVVSQQCCPLSATTCDAGGKYIMNPSTGDNITMFSACTVGNICTAMLMNSVNTTCLSANKDVTTISGSQCGNGIVEAGEDCDCGGTSGCGTDSCCDPTTCKFTANSLCDPSNEECCTSSCQFATNGTICRASTGVCNPQEVCNGASAACPADATAPDGTSCGNSTDPLTCISGQCTSRDLQCKSLMGSFTTGNDTYACSSSGCQISCASPDFGSNVCYSMQQNFLDGTPCDSGGKCSNGQCKGSTVGKEISSWIDSHKTLVIVLATVLGSLFLLVIAACIWSCFGRKKPVKRLNMAQTMAQNMAQNQRSYAPASQPNMPEWQQPPPPAWQPGPSMRYA